MAWTRTGDNIVTHPLMSRLLTACDFDHSLKNEAYGVLSLAATVAGAHLTDYIVEYGLIAQLAPGREKTVIDVLVAAGMLFRDDADGRQVLRIVDDPELIHNRSREEVEIDRRRASDKRNPELYPAVRYRDGDVCRWCGRTVSWVDRKSWRSATIDSLTAHKDSTVDTLVVACKHCNSKRGAGEELELRPAPSREDIFYTKHSIEYINRSSWAKEQGIHIEPRQTELDLGDRGAVAAPSRQQQVETGAAPEMAAASSHRAAPDVEAPGNDDPLEDAPDWVRESLADLSDRGAVAAPSRQQVETGAAPEMAAASSHRAAPDVEAPGNDDHVYNETVKPSTDLGRITDRRGDGSRFVGSGRDGNGLVGNGRDESVKRRRRRRGRRSGKKG
ncbi:hypothetical protein PBI_COLLEEN_51 [Corynebacterium phage Colleen]|uniref:HNH nuclease domain-containing protein n=4 Tax=root TaxID=1 RepID=W5XXA5_9CORY|nr:hypothetical protein [Corynebacterium vitaeruminis]YP_009626563.1 hypothetical protein FDK28_gp51 [Corynebacterium phage Poushou]AWY06499.1 hypothetical protein PBI_TOUCHMENOT_51 [Corynebacterium phage TouchMeNot]QFG14800.1 hypothetical protein PBI_COLLEEN_51 [Corynebacterium phage Colleen]UVT31937.1 hypothetical protein PBI_ARIANNA_51 [Corynebacterium phage Arianna]AHI21587.1 hypothetical protein B843_00955 [Corynebacterium vitaeruminis DSM 20294]ASJ79010.1 hypothetical protein PBI_POUSHO